MNYSANARNYSPLSVIIITVNYARPIITHSVATVNYLSTIINCLVNALNSYIFIRDYYTVFHNKYKLIGVRNGSLTESFKQAGTDPNPYVDPTGTPPSPN